MLGFKLFGSVTSILCFTTAVFVTQQSSSSQTVYTVLPCFSSFKNEELLSPFVCVHKCSSVCMLGVRMYVCTQACVCDGEGVLLNFVLFFLFLLEFID